MSRNWFLYDNDARTPISRRFNVSEGKPVVLTAGDLVDPVQIYVAVGKCIGCDNDVVWEPLSICGAPVELSPDNTMIALTAPGLYNLGDPSVDPLILGPNTNVIAQEVSEVPVELSERCSAPLKIETSCDEPLHVQICGMDQIEISDVKLGCALDVNGDPIGSVMFSRRFDEDTGIETTVLTAVLYDGTIVSPYTDLWGQCPPTDVCEPDVASGVLTTWG